MKIGHSSVTKTGKFCNIANVESFATFESCVGDCFILEIHRTENICQRPGRRIFYLTFLSVRKIFFEINKYF